MEKLKRVVNNMKSSITQNFRHATLNFIFILLFVNVFQKIFGMENSIVGVIFTIMMSASMVRDLTATPLRHLCMQSLVLFVMAAAACWVSNASPLWALPVNFAMVFLILYTFTFEYTSHLYFPYILSYLFLVFISPIAPAQLPKRLLGVLTGAVCIIAYQWLNGRHRVVETARDVLVSMIDRAETDIACLLSGQDLEKEPEKLRADLCKLSKIVYDRRKKVLCISDASFAMIDAGRGLENLCLLLYEWKKPLTQKNCELLQLIRYDLAAFRTFIRQQSVMLPILRREAFGPAEEADADQYYLCLAYVRDKMQQMIQPDKQKKYHKTLLSFSVRLKAALHVSPVRVVYALRVACLIALSTFMVQRLSLPHGKWLLFTIASVSLPYADDVGAKAAKRICATLLGIACSIVVFSLVSSATGRTLVMMFSGYLSFYFTGYTATFSCSTVGALGGALFMGVFGWGDVSAMSLVRLGYVIVGVCIALIGNLLFFPFTRSRATRQLFDKYIATTELLTDICHTRQADVQLYYGLVIQAHLQEEKLTENIKQLDWTGAQEVVNRCRMAVRRAHRFQTLSHAV